MFLAAKLFENDLYTLANQVQFQFQVSENSGIIVRYLADAAGPQTAPSGKYFRLHY